jgi:uncharacterized membrane protein YhaH (DUF805 family)
MLKRWKDRLLSGSSWPELIVGIAIILAPIGILALYIFKPS